MSLIFINNSKILNLSFIFYPTTSYIIIYKWPKIEFKSWKFIWSLLEKKGLAIFLRLRVKLLKWPGTKAKLIMLWKAPIGERDNSVYGLRAGSQGWKGEDGKAKTQWWERGMGIFPSPFLTTVFWPSHPPLSTLDFQPSGHKPNYLFLLLEVTLTFGGYWHWGHTSNWHWHWDKSIIMSQHWHWYWHWGLKNIDIETDIDAC